MDVYIFQAALLCSDCGAAARTRIHNYDQDNEPEDSEDESSYDSDSFPKGPYPDGGGESDTPQHCDRCGVFLDNPLTGDGETYVRDAFREFVATGRGSLDVLAEWKAAYDWCWDDFYSITFPMMEEEGLTDICQRRFDSLEAA